MKFIFYDFLTGEVTGMGLCSEADYSAQKFAGHLKMPFEGDPRTVWVDLTTMELKSKVEAPDFDRDDLSVAAEDVATCAPLPADAQFQINDSSWQPVGDGSLEIQCELPGLYVVRIKAPSLFTKEVTLNAY
jgi:hypothetical protein